MKRAKRAVIPFLAPVTKPAPTRVEMTPRERSQMRQQRILALQEIVRLRERQLEATKEEIAELEEREAIEEEERHREEDRREIEIEEEWFPDWDSDEFAEEYGDDIDYEIFTVLS